MKTTRTGFTLIEMLTVLAIITILIGLLIPALNMVRHMARDTQERSQLATISLGLEAWQQANSGSEYPASQATPINVGTAAVYTGAQRLAEAMVGLDMQGYNPTHPVADSDGTDPNVFYNNATLSQRQPPYIDLTHGRVFKVVSQNLTGEGIFDGFSGTNNLTPNSLVICDVYKRFNVSYRDSRDGTGSVVSTDQAGMPILYFAARQLVETPTSIEDYYHYDDNAAMMSVALDAMGKGNQVRTSGQFDTFIQDPRSLSQAYPYPYRRDSYLLISAGQDGIYFTNDDITNFN